MKSSPALNLPAPTARLAGALALGLVTACGGSGGGGPEGGGGTAPADSGELPAAVSLVSAAAGDGSVRLVWEALDPAGNAVPIAVFAATTPGAVYAGPPLAVGPAGNDLTVSGLANGQAQYYGLAIDAGMGGFLPAGEVLSARPGAPVYVDAASSAISPDGTTPATAFRDPAAGVQAAAAAGGGNVWVAAGDYAGVALDLLPGVDLYGGFDASLTLAGRDAGTHVTRFTGLAGEPLLQLAGGAAGSVVDGLVLDGDGVASFGVDLDETPAELRALDVIGCGGHGIRALSASTTAVTDLRLVACRVMANGGAGLSLDGAFDLTVRKARFSTSAAEGLALGGLVAHEGQSVRLAVRDSTCFGNGHQGLDCELVPPQVTGPGGATYTVTIERSSFDRNGALGAPDSTSGLHVDIAFDQVPGWFADIIVRGCAARGNAGAGVRLELDSTAATVVHRVLAAGNGDDGLLLSSKSTPGLALVASSACFGNQGFGIRATGGEVAVLVSHSVLSGNRLGGFESDAVESAMVSSIGWLQPSLSAGVYEVFDVEAGDPLLPAFERAPVAFQRVSSFIGGALQVEDATVLALGDTVEVGGDGVERTITGFSSGHSVFVAPAPESVPVPTSLARYAPAGPVRLDLTLAPASPAAGAGMPDPTFGPVDAGPFGAALGGAPGEEELAPAALWFLTGVLPAPGSVPGATDPIALAFDAPIDPLTVGAFTARVVGPSGLAPVSLTVTMTGALVITPSGSWPTGELRLELHAGLASTGGDPLAAPLALRFTAP